MSEDTEKDTLPDISASEPSGAEENSSLPVKKTDAETPLSVEESTSGEKSESETPPKKTPKKKTSKKKATPEKKEKKAAPEAPERVRLVNRTFQLLVVEMRDADGKFQSVQISAKSEVTWPKLPDYGADANIKVKRKYLQILPS